LARDLAVAAILIEMLPTLDDLERAREHGELEGGFKAVADQLEKLTNKLGLEKFGSAGEAFDPQIHEALIHATSNDVTAPTATAILQPGYRLKDRILRPARVAVTEPE
jgi:molecular chaperone GrpE